jgi:hypothetical protein
MGSTISTFRGTSACDLISKGLQHIQRSGINEFEQICSQSWLTQPPISRWLGDDEDLLRPATLMCFSYTRPHRAYIGLEHFYLAFS